MKSYFPFKAEGRAFQNAFTDGLRANQTESTSAFMSPENVLRFSHGRRWVSPAVNDDSEDSMTELSTTWDIKFDDVLSGDLNILPHSLRAISEELKSQFARMMYATVSSTCDRSGNIVDGRAKPISESFLEALSSIEFGVDRNGEVTLPQFHVHPSVGKKMIETLHAQPAGFSEKVERIKKEKTEAALRREAERKSKFKSDRE